jgi:hypothetical protein
MWFPVQACFAQIYQKSFRFGVSSMAKEKDYIEYIQLKAAQPASATIA